MFRTRLLAMIACLLLILTGCYSQPPAQTDISILMNSNSFQPANWRVPAGAAVTLHLTNQDAAAHQLMILYRQVVIPYGPADESSIFWSHSIAAGKSETIQFTAPAAAGDYDVIGADALQDGMVARLTVVRLDEIQP